MDRRGQRVDPEKPANPGGNRGQDLDPYPPDPGVVNADSGNIMQTAEFLSSLPEAPILVNILPYHDIMAGKYEKLGQRFNETRAMSEPDDQIIDAAREQFFRKGLEVVVGG